MKNNFMKTRMMRVSVALLAAAVLLTFGMMIGGWQPSGTAIAEANTTPVSEPASDPSPALYVAQKTANSVVGVITSAQTWSRQSGETTTTMIAQGSGVVIADGGYILTNHHVIEEGSAWQILMPSGEKVDATLVGSDSSTDLAVLKVSDEYASQLTPVTIGSSQNLQVGSTVVAIGNPGGEVLANTITQGIVSALERGDVGRSSRSIAYIQHDAAINSGNSGGGLFNYKGELVGINTLKYSGSAYSSVTFEGLGFAIPVETVDTIAQALIKDGKVIRPAMGVTVADFEGPDEPISDYPPKSVCVYSITKGSPAEEAGFQPYDFIYSIDDVRVTSLRELTAEMDKHQAGDTVEVKVVRYNNIQISGSASDSNSDSNDGSDDGSGSFGGFGGFGGYYGGRNNSSSVTGGYEFVTLTVKLAILD